ncbi:MAG: methionyl-tRNA formyltransferase [Candidatus Nealsonbacteria bacterium]|nr:methionyl-tRNA formyltransferase [Candidatus Nealsonbacteria bacterium]
MKIIFFGTPEFGAIVLKRLIGEGYKPVLVVTEPDKPVGRKQVVTPPPVKILAEKSSIPVLQPDKIKNSEREMKSLNPDLGIVAAYGQLIPKTILDIPKYGFLNVHPSILPKYRGPSPIQNAILNGDEEVGATIMQVGEKMDAGPIVVNSRFKIQDSRLTYQELHDKLAESGAGLLVKAIPDWVAGKIESRPQNDAEATYTKIIKKEDGNIDWKENASYIERQVRALNPWPGAFARSEAEGGNPRILKVLKASVQEQTKNGPFGDPGKTYLGTNERIAVQAGKDFLIIEKLQLEGGKPMNAADFLRGHQDFVGITLK